MLWAFLSVLAGFGDAVSYSMMKKLGNLDTYSKLLVYNLITLPLLLFGFLFYDVTVVDSNFYIIVLVNVSVLLTALFLMMKALQISDLSISIQMLSFTPIFLLFVSYLLLKEFPTLLGFIGIFIVVIGSYILNISFVKYGYFEPFKAIFKNKGIIYILIVAFLFSISA